MDFEIKVAEMLTAMRRYIMCKNQVHTLKVKVTLSGYASKMGSFLCPLHNFVIPCWILKILGRNFNHHETMWHVQGAGSHLQGQGHIRGYMSNLRCS